MNSAPTGMTLNCSRPFFIGPANEKSLKNKLYMFASLAFIGTAFTTALGVARSEAVSAVADSGKVSSKVLTKGVLDALTVVGLIPFGGTAADQLKSSQVELERWGPLIKRIGFSVDS